MAASAAGDLKTMSVAPLRLVAGPVVVHRRGREDFVVQRVERARDGLERGGPIRLQLLVHQALRKRRVVQGGEAVVRAPEAGAFLLQLPRQPLAAVEAHLHVEGEPGLDACVDETEGRVDEIFVEVEALTRYQPQPAFIFVLRSVV